MKKTMRKLVPAICMLLISAVLLGTSTYAWFSMNRKVTVTGMTVTTKVGSNLLIANPVDGEASFPAENAFQSGLNQEKTGLLEPTSTIDGISYFYNTAANTTASGSAVNATYVTYAPGDDFDKTYGVDANASTPDALGYIDYSFYLKAINAEASTQYLNMTRCNLVYQGADITEKAWRVAVFAKLAMTDEDPPATQVVTDATAVAEANRITILAPTSAAYFDNTATPTPKAVDSISSRAEVKTSANHGLGTAATIATLTSGTMTYYKVVVRLWLEGEDTTCNNQTFASLTKDYRLDLAFEIEDAVSELTVLGSTGAAIADATSNVGTVTLSGTTTGNITNGEKAVSFQWYNAANNTALTGSDGTGYNTYQYTNGAAALSVYCLVTTDRGNVYRTNTIELDEVAP